MGTDAPPFAFKRKLALEFEGVDGDSYWGDNQEFYAAQRQRTKATGALRQSFCDFIEADAQLRQEMCTQAADICANLDDDCARIIIKFVVQAGAQSNSVSFQQAYPGNLQGRNAEPA